MSERSVTHQDARVSAAAEALAIEFSRQAMLPESADTPENYQRWLPVAVRAILKAADAVDPELAAARSTIEQVRELHPKFMDTCRRCYSTWPCETIRIVGVSEATDGR